MKISAEARTCLAEFLEDAEDSFIRVGQTTVGGGCCSRLILGVSIDDELHEDDDLRMDVDGIPVVIDRHLNERLGEISIDVDPDKGIVINHN